MPATPAALLDRLVATGASLATAESLTGGLLGAAFTGVPGSSAAYRGGVVAYATDLKAALLDVDAGLLAAHGPVDAEVAVAMALGARARCAADYGLASTGVAGPSAQEGAPVGLVYVAVAGPAGTRVRELHLHGGRAQVRAGAVQAALDLLAEALEPGSAD